VGIIKAVKDGMVTTIEGNTGDGAGVVREGDGVYVRERQMKVTSGSMQVLGFIRVW
jgi:hypothetical protein